MLPVFPVFQRLKQEDVCSFATHYTVKFIFPSIQGFAEVAGMTLSSLSLTFQVLGSQVWAYMSSLFFKCMYVCMYGVCAHASVGVPGSQVRC